MADAVLPSNEQVAIKWLSGITALTGRVSTSLPSDLSTWAASGWVTVGGAGGSPHAYLPQQGPVVSVHGWGVTVSGSRPPWGVASDLLSAIRYGTNSVLDYANIGRLLTGFPAKYTNARVNAANLLGEPERRPGDPGDFAEYVVNLELQWVPLP
jgi:hypothetical protein